MLEKLEQIVDYEWTTYNMGSGKLYVKLEQIGDYEWNTYNIGSGKLYVKIDKVPVKSRKLPLC